MDPEVTDSVTEVEDEADSVAEADVADLVDDTRVVDSAERVVESALDTVVKAVSEVADSVEDTASGVALDSVALEVSVLVSVTVEDSDSSEEVTEVEVADDTVRTEEDPTNSQLARQTYAMKHPLLT